MDVYKQYKYFIINEKTPIYLYGAGAFGRNVASNLIKAGYYLCGFIDKNTDLINKDMLLNPVYNPEEFFQKENRDEVVIVITIHNALIHDDIARVLSAKGFLNILFLPTGETYLYKIKMQLYKFYNLFCIGNDFSKPYKIPCYNELEFFDINYKNYIIEEENEDIVCMLDSGILFSSLYEDTDDKYEEHEFIKLYSDIPLSCMKPHINLFQYFEDGKADVALYLLLYKQTSNTFDEQTKEEFLSDRKNLFIKLKKEFSFGMEYFVNSPVVVQWNEKAYFNILDGHHRAAFLFVQRHKYIPVRMKKKHFQCWYQNSSLVWFRENIFKQRIIHKLYAPVSNLVFQRLDVTVDKWERTFLTIFNQWLMDKRNIIKSSIEIGKFQAYFSRDLSRLKLKKVYFCELGFSNIEIDKWLNRVHAVSGIECFDNINFLKEIKQADLLVIGQMVSSFGNDRLGEEWYKRIFLIPFKYIFFISEIDADKEKKKILSYFPDAKYTLLETIKECEEETEIGFFELIGMTEREEV